MGNGGILTSRSPRRRAIVVIVIAALAVYWFFFSSGKAYAPVPLFDLHEPQRTQIVPTLDTPIESGKNAVWCASFVAAWKHLQNDLAGGTIELDGAEEVWKRLNVATDPKNDVPASSLYATAGRFEDDIAGKIRGAVAKQFPNSPPPSLPKMSSGDLLAYARLEVSAKFPVPYFDLPWPLDWIDGSGNKIRVRGFGIHEKGYASLREQPRVLFGGGMRSLEFALDLNDRSQPVQIIVAQIPRQPTLADAMAYLDQKAKEEKPDSAERMIESDARLGVPEMAWRIQHQFKELENRNFTSGRLKDQMARLINASQDIEFRLDRSGAELRSEARIRVATLGVTPSYFIRGPYLLALRIRGVERPFFAAWVDNDELLRRYGSTSETN